MESDVTRRSALAGLGLAGLGFASASCATYGDEGAAREPAGAASGDGPARSATVAASDVPVGGGVVLADERVVVCQPEAGKFVAFSAVCTHAGCLVSEVSDGTVNCPCHGSRFGVDDGGVVGGPAPDPLPPHRVTVRSGTVAIG